MALNYRKVESTSPSRLEAHAGSRTGNEAARVHAISAFALASATVGAAVEHNDIILMNLMTSHCFNPIP